MDLLITLKGNLGSLKGNQRDIHGYNPSFQDVIG